MKRLGLFSGTIYEEYEIKDMGECGMCITDEQAEDRDYIERMKDENSIKCGGCFGCPMAEIML